MNGYLFIAFIAVYSWFDIYIIFVFLMYFKTVLENNFDYSVFYLYIKFQKLELLI